MKRIYPAIFYPFEDGSGGYTIDFPDLPGCVTEGRDLEESFYMANDAACGWILGELEEGLPVPEPSPYEKVQPGPGGQVNMMVLDIDAYAEKYGNKAVRKNLTIPAWLNTFAEKHNLNFSQVLQEALLQKAKDMK